MIKDDLIRYAQSLGFDRVGVTCAEPLPEQAARLDAWLAQGFEGDMDYMRRAPERRADPQAHLPGAKSVIVMAMRYGNSSSFSRHSPRLPFFRHSPRLLAGNLHVDPPPVAAGDDGKNVAAKDDGNSGKIARYAQSKDYHGVLHKRLDAFTRYLDALAPGHQHRTFVDSGPLLERAFAQRAGIGFVGKNTLVIGKGLGSYFFLASVITTLELPEDAPDTRTCGSCRKCLDACPTQAFTGPFELNATRCISYLTIESEGPIDPELREKMGGWVFGCDVCQEVCPHNTPSRHSPRSPFFRHPPRPLAEDPRLDSPPATAGNDGWTINLEEILSIDSEKFQILFKGTPLTRAGREGLVRNACVAAGNLGRYDLIPALERLSREDASHFIREHAVWALSRLSKSAS